MRRNIYLKLEKLYMKFDYMVQILYSGLTLNNDGLSINVIKYMLSYN